MIFLNSAFECVRGGGGGGGGQSVLKTLHILQENSQKEKKRKKRFVIFYSAKTDMLTHKFWPLRKTEIENENKQKSLKFKEYSVPQEKNKYQD